MSEKRLTGGIHAVGTLLRHGADTVSALWFDAERRDKRLAALLDDARRRGLEPRPSGRKELDRLLSGGKHQGVVAESDAPAQRSERDLDELLGGLDRPPLLLVLDGVEDPHNLGACLRTADAAGVSAVIAPRDRAAGLTPTVCKVASGAAESVPFVQVTNLARTLRHLQQAYGIWVVGTAAGEGATSLFEIDLKGPLALVLGAEGEGIRRLTRETCDVLASLPMLGTIESLNVSVAAGVCLYEAMRQRSPS